MTIKQKIRSIIRWIITLWSYILTILFLFKNHELIWSLVSLFIFFISFHFLYLELYKFPKKYFIIACILWIIFTACLNFSLDIVTVVANILFHIGIFILWKSLHHQITGTIKFNSLNYFLTNGYIFTMIISLTYSSIIITWFKKFPMNCEELNEKYNKTIEVFTTPFNKSLETTKEITKKLNFFSSTFKDISDFWKSFEIKNWKENTLLSKLKFFQKNVTETIEENRLLNNTICDYTLNVVNQKLQSPKIQYPVILFIIFLIYPFLRVIISIISIIWFIFFKINIRCKIYTKSSEQKTTEIIE